MTTKALRFNEGKPKWSMVHFPSLEALPHVLEYGAQKYEVDNWKKPMDLSEILNSMMRHQIDLMEGKLIDEESGLPIIGHLVANCMFFSYHSNMNFMKIRGELYHTTLALWHD